MKKLLFLLLLIKVVFLWGQGGQAEYKFELYNLRFELREPVKNNTSSNVTLTLKYEDNSEEQIYYRSITEEEHDEWDWNLNPPIIRSKKPVSIRVSGFVNFRSGTDANYDVTNGLTTCLLQNFSVASNSPRMSEITFKTRVTPVHTLVSLTDTGSTNTFLPSDDMKHRYCCTLIIYLPMLFLMSGKLQVQHHLRQPRLIRISISAMPGHILSF